jgi:hypothetical protein
VFDSDRGTYDHVRRKREDGVLDVALSNQQANG